MNIHHQNSFVRQRPLNLSIVPFQPVRNNLSRTARQESDTVELSYSHGKPSTSADVMTPVCRVFQLPETAEGAAEEARHTVTASGQVDDSVTVTVDSNTQSSSPGSVHNFSLEFGNLSGGFHCLVAEHHNINYYPNPTGNISLINGTIGPCPPSASFRMKMKKMNANAPAKMGRGIQAALPRIRPPAPWRGTGSCPEQHLSRRTGFPAGNLAVHALVRLLWRLPGNGRHSFRAPGGHGVSVFRLSADT